METEHKGRTWYARGVCLCEGAVAAREEDERRRADEQRAQQAAALAGRKKGCGLVGALQRQTFEAFDRSRQPGAYDVAESFFEEPRSLVFTGSNGLGKTHLTAAIANRCVELGCSVRFGTLAEYLAQIRATYSQESEITTDKYVGLLTGVYLLCIDDVGKERMTDWAREQLFLVVNARYNLRPAGYMVLTSNEYGQRGERLAACIGIHNWSRLQEIATMKHMVGSDYRLRERPGRGS